MSSLRVRRRGFDCEANRAGELCSGAGAILAAGRSWVLAAAATLALWAAGSAVAVAAPPAGGAGDQPAGKPAEAPPASLYDLPPGDDADALAAFLQRLLNFEPNTPEEAREYQAKARVVAEFAAEKILKLEKDPQSQRAQGARLLLTQLHISMIPTLSPEKLNTLVESVNKRVAGGAAAQADIQLAMMLGQSLEMYGKTELASQTYATLSKALASSDNEQFRELSKQLAGAERRLTSVGKPFELTGQTIDGKPFDWAKYRGKVVLVDFWATWCGPCRAELPNVKQNYEKYRAQGFDVVGVSVDKDHEALVSFLNEEKLPWTTVQDASDDPSKTSVAEHYGIFAIPQTFLVDRQGNVLSTSARGETLAPQIEKALAAAPAPAASKPAPVKTAPAKAPARK